jgi:hypothetical protein
MFCPPIPIAARAPKARRRPSRHKLSNGLLRGPLMDRVVVALLGPLARLAGPLFAVWWSPPREPGDFLKFLECRCACQVFD